MQPWRKTGEESRECLPKRFAFADERAGSSEAAESPSSVPKLEELRAHFESDRLPLATQAS